MKQIIISLMLILSINSFGQQFFTTFSPGITNRFVSGDLQVGTRIGNTTLSAGYICLLDNSQPTLFNARVGYIAGRVHAYAGAVNVLQSVDYKERNYNTWQLGASYHFLYFERTTFLVSATYSPLYMTVSAGMSYNIFNDY